LLLNGHWMIPHLKAELTKDKGVSEGMSFSGEARSIAASEI
jgi:hypothetical protein